jgi:hypothetical protein
MGRIDSNAFSGGEIRETIIRHFEVEAVDAFDW